MSDRTLATINAVLMTCVIVMSFTVDGNGRIFGLAETASVIIITLFFGCGIIMGLITAITSKRLRLGAIICLIIYLLLLAPAFLP